MKISKISLVNFRNYSSVLVNLNKKMNIFIGDNAQGKTNILESIVILALTKSHRVGNNPNIIQFGKSKSTIKGTIRKDNIISKLEVSVTNDTKKTSVNGTEVKKLSDYISNLNVIVFTPDDLDIIKGSPNIRRNLLNIQLSQISKVYLNTYNEYNKILKTRNEYLKILFSSSIADKKYLDIITDRLIEKAIIIYQKRREYLDFVNEYIDTYFSDISNTNGLKIVYLPNVEFSSYDTLEMQNTLKKIFTKNYMKELNNGMTLYGPHRDDFVFQFLDNDLKYFGSQGQHRIAILCFKLSEIEMMRENKYVKPILLLDDIFSELDKEKKENIIKYIDNDLQVFITSTDINNIDTKLIEKADVFYVENAKVYERGEKDGRE